MSAFHHTPSLIDRPCPGPGDIVEGQAPTDPCPRGAMIGMRGKRAKRCEDCADTRESRYDVEAKRRKAHNNRARMQKVTGIKRAGLGKTQRALDHEPKRQAIKRCRVCLGDPHMREQSREDDFGNPVCLPGMNRCRLCWEPYAPLPNIHAQAVLGSSAALAVGGSLW